MPATLVKGTYGMAILSSRLLVPTAQGRSRSLGKHGRRRPCWLSLTNAVSQGILPWATKSTGTSWKEISNNKLNTLKKFYCK